MATVDKNKPAKGESEMSKRFRQNPLVFVGTFAILVIVVIAFVFVTPAGSIIGGMDDGWTFGRYDRVPIAFSPGNHFAQEYEWRARQMQHFMANEQSPQMLRHMEHNIWRGAFEAAAVQIAIMRAMSRAGYEPPAQVVDRAVAALPIFHDDQGRFSHALYRAMDESRRLAIWRHERDGIMRSRFIDDAGALLTSSAEADFVGRMASTERSFDMAIFSVDDLPDSELEAYALENPEMFRSVHLSIISVHGNEAEARAIRDSVLEGEVSFEDAAREHSTQFGFRGGDMGEMMAHELAGHVPDAAAREMALALAAGEYSELMWTVNGWVFFRAESDVADADFGSEAVLSGIRTHMQSFARGRMADWAIAQAGLFAERVSELGFNAALAEFDGVQRRSFGPIPINVGGIDLFGTVAAQGVDELWGAADNEQFWTVAFSTAVGSASEPVEQGGNVLVLFPTSETEAHASETARLAAIFGDRADDMNWELLHRHIMNSPRMQDRFQEAFDRMFPPVAAAGMFDFDFGGW